MVSQQIPPGGAIVQLDTHLFKIILLVELNLNKYFTKFNF